MKHNEIKENCILSFHEHQDINLNKLTKDFIQLEIFVLHVERNTYPNRQILYYCWVPWLKGAEEHYPSPSCERRNQSIYTIEGLYEDRKKWEEMYHKQEESDIQDIIQDIKIICVGPDDFEARWYPSDWKGGGMHRVIASATSRKKCTEKALVWEVKREENN